MTKPIESSFIGTIHNAKACTFDGRDCFVAAICDARGHFDCRMANVAEFSTEIAAEEWLNEELRARGRPYKIEKRRS